MTRAVSETSLVSNSSPFQLETSQITIHDEDENSNNLDISKYCPNREVVNLENAAVNIDNSTDVIIGPVTQFNVNGNVTIVSNDSEAVNGTLIEGQQARYNLTNGDSKNNLTLNIFRLLYTNKDIIRNLVILLAICFIFLTMCLITSMILIQKRRHETDEYNYNYTEYDFGNHLGQHKVYYRKDWGGKPPKNNTVPLKHPVSLIIISHTATLPCNFTDQCCSTLRDVQMKHFAKPLRAVDIGYNFMIGGDGNIFVGRGWDIQNFHKKVSVGISFIGNFNFDSVSPEMIRAAKDLVKKGLELRKISEDYVLVGENQTNPRMYLSPGREVYKVIKEWPHFYNNTMF